MAVFTRRNVLLGGAGIVVAGGAAAWLALRPKPVPIGFELSDEELAHANALLKAHPAIDTHAHPGRTFTRGAKGLTGQMKLYAALGTFEKKAVAHMREGNMAAAAFATVSDFQVLGLGDTGLAAVREFEPGEAWESYKRQIGNMQALVDDGLVTRLDRPTDLALAHADGKIGAMFTAEGGDFLEGQADRIPEAYADGLRGITIMHYAPNALGDTMTGEEVHGGLTQAGVEVVQMMNTAGMVIDIAHASEATCRGVLDATSKPLLCSHTHILGDTVPDIHRFITLELARDIADAGGVIGVWPAGLGITDLNGLVDRAMELVNAVGIDHVTLGTDMDANYKPVMETYKKTPWLVGGLIKRGLSDVDVMKIMGGNFMNVWEATAQA